MYVCTYVRMYVCKYIYVFFLFILFMECYNIKTNMLILPHIPIPYPNAKCCFANPFAGNRGDTLLQRTFKRLSQLCGEDVLILPPRTGLEYAHRHQIQGKSTEMGIDMGKSLN